MAAIAADMVFKFIEVFVTCDIRDYKFTQKEGFGQLYGEDEAHLQEEGPLKMLICNTDQLIVEDEQGELYAHATISFCPMCGEML